MENNALHPAYFAIAFRTEAPVTAWPADFVILTAYATTGETWSPERNSEADQRLHAELVRRGCTPLRITGYDPQSGHAEPGWAVEMMVEDALDLGCAYLQDAIFAVNEDALFVYRCAEPRECVRVGDFRVRTNTRVG